MQEQSNRFNLHVRLEDMAFGVSLFYAYWLSDLARTGPNPTETIESILAWIRDITTQKGHTQKAQATKAL
jgi:hypothetical protein